MKDSLLFYLENVFGKEKFLYTSIPDRFCFDEATIYKAIPEAVFIPESEDEVVDFVKIAVEKKIKIVPRGAGTGVCGGAVALFGGVVLSFERMNRIKGFDEANLCIEVEPGVINGDLKKFLEEKNYYYPPDPQSYETSTIGGNIATNAGGPKAIRYGTTKDYVMSLNIITGTGKKIISGGKVYKYSSGYNLNELFCGSEGTLGLVTKAIIRFIPKVNDRVLFLLPFRNIHDALNFVVDVQKEQFIFSAFEFIDDTSIYYIERFLNRKLPYSEMSKCYVFAEMEGHKSISNFEKIEVLATKNNSKEVFIATDRLNEERLWEARKKISYAFKEFSKKIYKADIVVPRGQIAYFIENIKHIGNEKTPIACFGHIGDGNVHINILDVEGISEEYANSLMNKVMELVKKCNGFPSGEHGIGVAKKEFLKKFFSLYHINVWRRIKKIFDPYNIMNPGKII